MRAAALAAARRGWAVFPCRPGDKRPAIDRWEERACADPELVARCWPSQRHNVGIACGPSRLVVIDLDTAEHGGSLPPSWAAEPGVRDGRDVLRVLALRAGEPWPDTYTTRTPSGGLHLYFAAIEGRTLRNSASRIGPMIDVRGPGGYVVGPGSVTARGRYRVVCDDRVRTLPGWLADLAEPPRIARAAPTSMGAGPVYGRLRAIVEAVLTSEPGTRNGRLFWAACRAGEMVAAGKIDAVAAEEALIRAAVEAGLRGGETEARRTVASGLRSAGGTG
jgi:hypothetical protein